MQRSRGIAHPTGIETHVDDHVLDFRQASSVAIVEQETARGTEGILAEVALSSSGRFTAFDDLVTLTVRASDGDERHGPFLPKGGYEDEAQCDSNRSPSPLLKHYRCPVCGEEMLVNEAIIDVAVSAAKFRGEYTGGMPTIGCPGCNGETMAYVEQEP